MNARAAASLLVVFLASTAVAAPLVRNGFRLDARRIDPAEILAGGPPRDAIPALDDPRRVPAEEAAWGDDEVVIGVVHAGEARAYPLAVLVWHELANDTLGGQPILVSYCPLCGTGMVFDRRIAGRERHFGVSGLLYRSDLLLYDRETESLWSQIAAEALTGPAQGARLALVRSRMLRWGDWRREHPGTTVITSDTGHDRRYGESPYGDYATDERLLFSVPSDARYHPKTPTIGLRVAGGVARAYPALELVRAGGAVRERFAGVEVVVAYDAPRQTFRVEAPTGIEIVEGYWFAWAAFHPETSVFTAPEKTQPTDPKE